MFDEPVAGTIRKARGQGLGDLLHRSAARTPDKLAIVHRDVRQTYAELDESVNRTANALRARGVGQGDRFAMLGHNSHQFVVVHFALARLGAVSVPINFMLKAEEVAYVLDHAGTSGMVVEDALGPVAQHALESLGDGHPHGVLGVMGDGEVAGWEPVAGWLRHDDASRPQVEVGDDDVVQLMYTSGTESRPKGAALSSRSLVSQYVSCIVDGRMTADDVEAHALPLYHCAQMHCFLTPDLYLGATSIVLDGPDPAVLLGTIERERVTKLFCPPTVWISLLRHPDFDRRDLSSLTKGYYGASIMPVEVLKELLQRLPGVSLFNFYGQTEMAPLATLLPPEEQVRKAGSAGRAALNVETRVVDDDDEPVAPGTIGEIVHRSPHAMLGYWNDPEKTAEAFRNGWFHSGDLGVLDEEGYLTVVDRKKDMIKTGGENVASREVEEVIYGHPAVSEVAVFGTSDPRWIEAVTAAVVPRQGGAVDPDEPVAFCKERMAGYKVPKRVVVVDSLPKNASGKVLKRELRASVG